MAYTPADVNAWYQAVQFRDGPTATVDSWVALLNNGGATSTEVQNAIVADTFTSTYVNPMIRIYQAAFNRVPDQAGQNFWIDNFAAGNVTTQTAADNFANSDEFKATYGNASAADPINAAVLTAFYQNVLGRSPDQAGYDFWLNSGQNIGQVLNYFAQSPEFTVRAADPISQFQHAEIAGNPATSGSLFVNYPPINPVDAGTFTTNIDTIDATAPGVYNVVKGGLQNAGAATETFNTGDTVNGNGLTEVQLIANNGGVGVAAGSVVTLNNIKTVNTNLVSGTRLDASAWTNVATLNVNAGVAGATLQVDAAELGTTYQLATAGRNQTLTIGSWASATGTSDLAKLSAAGTGNSTTPSTFNVGGANDVELVALATSGTNFVSVAGGTAAKTWTITGDGNNDITISSAAATSKTIDMSGSTGANIVRLGTLLSTTDTIKGGSGVDEVYATFGTATSFNPTISGVEEMALTFNAAAIFNASKWTGGKVLDITPTGANNTSVTNLDASVTEIHYGEGAVITATGANSIGYKSGSNSDVNVFVGATATATDPAVSIGNLTFTNNAGALAIKSVGDAANIVGNITADKASSLTLVGVDQNLTASALSALNASAFTVDALAHDVTATTLAVDESLTTFDVKSDAGAVSLGATTQTSAAGGGAIDTTYTITGGASTVAVGAITASTAAADANLTANINVTAGAGTVGVGALSFTGSGALASDTTDVTLTAEGTQSTGVITLAGLVIDEGAAGTSTSAVNLKGSGGAVTLALLDLTDSDTNTITLDAASSNVAITTLDNRASTTTDIVVSAASGKTATIGTLAHTGVAANNLNTITATGAGTISLFATGTAAVGGDANIDSTGTTGNFTVDLAAATGNLTVNLGNAASGKTNTVTTGTGTDTIVGGSGHDVMKGGLNIDTITTGAGNDTVIFSNALTSDIVADFSLNGADIASYDLSDLTTLGAIKALVTADITGGTSVSVAAGAAATFLSVAGATSLTAANVLNVAGSFASASAVETALGGGTRALTTNAVTGMSASDAITIQWQGTDGNAHVGVVLFDLGVAAATAVTVADISVIEIATLGVTPLTTSNFAWQA